MSSYKRTMPKETKEKISKSLRGRKLTSSHKENIGRAIRAKWEQVPLSKDSDLVLDCLIDRENKELKKVMFNGFEIHVFD